MLRLKFLIFIMSLLFLISKATAAESHVLTLEDCIKTGFTNSKTIKISKSKVVAANAKVSEVNATMLPTVRFTGGYSRLSPIEPFVVSFYNMTFNISPVLLNSYQFRFSLNQPIFTGYRLQSNSEISEFNAEATEEDLKKDMNQLVLDIKNAFWSYFNALESKKTIDESIDQLKSHVHDIENMLKSGLATTNDVLKTKVQLSNLELSRIDVENGVQTAMMALNNIIGLPVTDNTEIKSEVNYTENTALSQDDILRKAINERSELKSMEYRLKAGESGVTLAKSGWYPQLSFGANYLMANPNPRIMPAEDKFLGTWDVSLNLSFDIWNWLTTARQTTQAQELLEQSRYGYSQLKDAITLEVSQNYLSLNKFKEKINFAKSNIEQAEENYRVTNEKFKSGLAINSDLLDAETSLLLSKINLTTAIVEYEIALAKLEKSIGSKINN